MAVVSRTHVLAVIRRTYGPEQAQWLAERLPERIDLDSDADNRLLFELGLTRDRLFNDLGAEL